MNVLVNGASQFFGAAAIILIFLCIIGFAVSVFRKRD